LILFLKYKNLTVIFLPSCHESHIEITFMGHPKHRFKL
jgi:hypothetical protein